jgi:hypothetical protein
MRRILQLSGPKRLAAFAATASTLVATIGLTAGPARSAPSTQCPALYPESSLTVGAPVTGLTVTAGTTPDGFTGKVLGVLEDGIAPGVDMVMMDLHSTTIDKVGMFEGMSGSPVYAADGRLVGAVAYGLSVGPSTVAGVTPAADMQRLLTGTTPASSAVRTRIALPAALAARVVRSGAATRSQVSQGMHQLRVPFGVSGLTGARLKKVAPVLDFGDVHLLDAPAGPASTEPIDVTAGGNLAASVSYGVVTAAGLGTATMVCGDQVVGFGHPMSFSGHSTMSLHGARAVYVQNDPTLPGFKVANLGAPVGTVDGDRLAGVHAVKGVLPVSRDVTSLATNGATRFSGTTHVTVPEMLPEIGFLTMIGIQDRALDRTGPGTAWAGWTIKGLRKNGTPFALTRRSLYADSADVSAATALALADDLTAIQDNDGEVVKITSVDTESHVGIPYETYAISKIQARMFGRWIPVGGSRPVPLRAGTVARLKVFLTSREGAPRTLVVRVHVPTHAAGRVGTLHVIGGNNDAEDSGDFFDEGDGAFDSPPAPSPSTFPNLLKALAARPQHNEVVATLRFRHAPGTASRPRVGERALNRVVSGDVSAPVVALP